MGGFIFLESTFNTFLPLLLSLIGYIISLIRGEYPVLE